MTADRVAELRGALARVRSRVDAAATAAGRDPSSVTLLPVTKFFPAEDVMDLVGLGCRSFGESREQEGRAKAQRCADLGAAGAGEGEEELHWHMLGTVQRNKSRSLCRWADTVHSVDSVRLVAALSTAAERAIDAGERSAPLRVFLQISIDGDPARGGVPVDGLAELADAAADARGLRLAGLMAVPPIGVEPDAAFAELAALRTRFLADHPGASELSAGMSGDLEAAIRHGSTCVRVGTALMGARPIASR